MVGNVIGRGLPLPVGTVGTAKGSSGLSGFEAALRAAQSGSPSRSMGSLSPFSTGATAPGQTSAGGNKTAFDDLIRATAQRVGIDEQLVKAVVEAESGFNPRAVSAAGAKGLMQLMDGTARALGVKDSFDPASNIEGGARFLRSMLDRFGSLPIALAAYNAGPGAVESYGGIPPFQETRTYVDRVLQLMRRNQMEAATASRGDGETGGNDA